MCEIYNPGKSTKIVRRCIHNGRKQAGQTNTRGRRTLEQRSENNFRSERNKTGKKKLNDRQKKKNMEE